METKVILVGGFHEVIELCESCGMEIVGLIDNKLTGKYLGYDVLGGDSAARDILIQMKGVPVVITPDLPAGRKRLADLYSNIGFAFTSVVSQRATVSRLARIGAGVVIQSGANISSNVDLQRFVRINTMANVMHDVLIGEFTTIAPNAVILGRVKIGDGCYIGANATILPGLEVGSSAIVGAGAVVTRDVSPNTTVVGNPASELRRS